MAHLRILAGSALVLSMSFGASAQVMTVTEAVPAAETEIVRAQYIREGDVSPEEYAALLAEAERVRAYQGHSSNYTGVSYEAATSQNSDTLGYQIDIYDAGTASSRESYSQAGSAYNVVTEPVTSAPLQYPMAKTYPLGTDFSTPEFQSGYSSDQGSTTYVSAPRVTYEAPNRSFETSQSTRHYVVKGDTLYNIAKRNGTSVTAIKTANGLTDNTIGLGQTLIVPSASRVVNVQPYQQYTAPVTTVSSVIAQEPVQSGSRPTLVRNVEPIPSSSIYAVLPKDTLYSISQRACVSVADIRSVNGNIDPQTLQPGQRLTLPGGHCLR
jgi:LysM repeat protein